MESEHVRECAASVLDTTHLIPRVIHGEMRRRGTEMLSMQQFRAMMIVKHHEGTSLSGLAERLGATLPATSKLVDGLVDLDYVARESSRDDRRRLALSVTGAGEDALEAVRMKVLSLLTEKLSTLSAGECAVVMLAMDLLRGALTSGAGLDDELP